MKESLKPWEQDFFDGGCTLCWDANWGGKVREKLKVFLSVCRLVCEENSHKESTRESLKGK